MGDRRTARANRLLDPTWHGLQKALDRLYREIEPDALPQGLALIVQNPVDGTTSTYVVDARGAGTIQRSLITDVAGLVETFADSPHVVDTTPDVP